MFLDLIGGYSGNPMEKINEHIEYLENKTSEEKETLDAANENRDSAYETYTYVKNIFDRNSSDMTALKNKIKMLELERDAAVKAAVEEAKAAGKSQTEIDRISDEVYNRHSAGINLVMYQMVESTKNYKLSSINSDEAESAYRKSRFDSTSASNKYISGLRYLEGVYLYKGKLQQQSIFLANTQKLS